MALLVLNFALGGYQAWLSRQPLVEAQPAISAQFDNLALTADQQSRLEVSADIVSTQVEVTPSASVCVRITGLKDGDSLPVVESRLKALELSVEQERIRDVYKREYQVILGPFNSIDEARAELVVVSAKGFEGFVMPLGEQANSLSLGLFSNRENANRRIAELEAVDIVARSIELERYNEAIQLVLDEKSQYKGNVKYSEEHVSHVVKSDMSGERLQVSIAADSTAYNGTNLSRSITMINEPEISNRPFLIDLYHIDSKTSHQMDLNYPFFGDIIDTQFDYSRPVNKTVLGKDNGYNHLEVLAQGSPKSNATNTQFSFLQAQRFYSITSVADASTQLFITQTGANDPEFNINLQRQYLIRQPKNKTSHTFASVIEPHGFFDPVKETVTYPKSVISNLKHEQQDGYDIVTFNAGGAMYLYTLSRKRDNNKNHTIEYNGKSYSWDGTHQLIKL